MGQFFKFMFASCLGLFLGLLLLSGISALAIAQISKSASKPKAIKANSVLHLTLDQPIPEQTNNLELNPFEFKQDNILGLTAIVETIDRAAQDDKIKGLFFEPDMLLSSGLASSTVLHDALLRFKAEGKFIIAYAKYYSQGAYYLASTADAIYLNPLGIVDFRGFSTQIPFFKDMLDRVGINMQVYYAGKFKGATEPYRLNELSDENRLQIRTYLDGLYDEFLQGLSSARGIPVDSLRELANRYTGMDPYAAQQAGLVDEVAHRDIALEVLRERLALEEDDKIPQISLADYAKSNPKEKDYNIKNKVALIYAEGAIVDGKGGPGGIGDDKYVEYIKEARKDERVKAIVLRVNSPGGSAVASESIWRELELAKQDGKPVVISMGDYAASGGYYIAAGADSIFAEPSTLTGSIGVFSIIPDASKLLEDKIGIHFDTVKTGDFSLGITPFFTDSPQEQRLMQSRTESMYETFLKRVSDGRGMSRDSVHAIAQGRVWTGRMGVEVGLVDDIGGLDRALSAAAALADLEAYRLTEYPRVKDPLQLLMEQWLGEDNVRAQAMLRRELGAYYPHYRSAKEILESRGAQARLPVLVNF